MPAPSAASLRRKALGIEHPKDHKKAEAGRKGAIKKHGFTKQQLNGKESAAITQINRAHFVANQIHAQMLSARNEASSVIAQAVPIAARYMLDLITGVYEDASHTVRLEAGKTVLKAGGLLGDKQQDDRKELGDMDLSELQAFISAGASKLAEIRQRKEDPIDGVSVTVSDDTSSPV